MRPPNATRAALARPGNGSQNGVQLGGEQPFPCKSSAANQQARDLAAAVVRAQDCTRPCGCEHVIEVSLHIRPDGTKHPNVFDARLAGSDEVLCVSATPLLTAARLLLKAGKADPDDVLVMRHAGSGAVALKGRIGLAASLTIEETPFGPKRRRYKPRSSLEGSPRIAQTPPTVPEPFLRETGLYDIPPELRRLS